MGPKSTSVDLTPKYAEGEKILCFHGPLIYQARCLKVEVKDKCVKYFVHYQGWNKNWDEWVTDARMMKFDATGLQKQKEIERVYLKGGKKVKALRKSDLQVYPVEAPLRILDKKLEEEKTPSATPATSEPQEDKKPLVESSAAAESVSGSAGSRRTAAVPAATASDCGAVTPAVPPSSKRPRLEPSIPETADNKDVIASVPTEEVVARKMQIKFDIPVELRGWLADDHDLINRQNKLHNLPAPRTAQDLLDEFAKHKLHKSTPQLRDQIMEFTQGLRDYFTSTLGTQLLYRFERAQYAEMLLSQKDKQLTDVYGVIHLLRLFVRLPDLLSYTKLDTKCVPQIVNHVNDLLLFIERHICDFVKVDDYYTTSPDYQRKVLGC